MKSIIIFTFSYLLIVNNTYSRTSESLRVTLPNGSKLVGRHLSAHNGRGIRAFMGIPYAEPPIGDLRFRAPVPIAPWTDEKQTVQDSAICIQRDPFRRDFEIAGDEDCLYLNVYAPQFPESTQSKLPVMIFFHGGGWQCGSGISAFYGPDYLLEHDIIYIGVNFRLGPLGFLSTGTEDCPGNNGLKDQVLALKWIKENIGAFGGDPNQVTVFGESAGGASVTYFMMSPLTKGLFHKAISQSGTNLNPWSQPAHEGVAQRRANELGELMGCKTEKNDWPVLLKCLRTISAVNITGAFYDFFKWDTDPMIPFPPVVEPNLPGAFITKHPRDEIQPHGNEIPWMAGLTLDEGAMKAAPVIVIPGLYEDLKENYKLALPISLNYDHHSESVQTQMTENIYKFYFDNKFFEKDNYQNLINLYTDSWFLAGIDEYIRIRLTKSKSAAPTYVYLFAHSGQASLTEIFKGGRENNYGVCHADELQYLFPLGKQLFISAAPTKTDIKIRQVLTEMWVNFAKTGNPTPSSSRENSLPTWKPAKSYPLNYLRIGNKDNEDQPLIGMEIGLMENRVNFWHNLKAHLPSKNIVKEEL